MIDNFINRKKELMMLEERFRSNKPELLILYGRRRVGKTELIKQFMKDKPHIYFLSDKTHEKEQLKEVSKKIGEFFNDKLLINRGFGSWIDIFEYLNEKLKNRIIFVIDEFPFLMTANKAISSIFQKGWDEYLQNTKIFLILCGSSIAMMEKGTLSYKSPLYGRRTGQWKLEPLNFYETEEFFPNYSMERTIEAFSILGGIPAYLKQFDDMKDIFYNIKEKILRKDSFLYNEPEFVLREELKEPKTYFSVLKNLSFGKNRLNEIATSLGMERNKVSMYLSVLENLNIIERIIPITEKHPHKSRKGLYFIKDNFFKFWFRFVFPNRGDIEEGNVESVLKNKIMPNFNQSVSLVFEDICTQIIRRKPLFNIEKIGKWWYKDKEIDIVALNDNTKEILFCECKWQDKINAEKILSELKEKSKFVDWNKDKKKEYFAIFAKSFKKKIGENNVFCFDLKDIENILVKH